MNILLKKYLDHHEKYRRLIIMVETKKVTFNWKIWALKIAKNALYVVIAGLAVTYGDNPYYLAIAPLLAGLENYIKHK